MSVLPLRWLVTKYPKPSMQDVKEYQNLHACGFNSAKQVLSRPDEKVLQFFDGIAWLDVPVIVEMVDE